MTVALRSSRRSKTKIKVMWRLKLGCGHTAFSLATEPHEATRIRQCYPCGGYTRIITADSFSYRISAEPRRLASTLIRAID